MSLKPRYLPKTLIATASLAEREAVDSLRDAWKSIQMLKPRRGWPKGGPELPQRVSDHLSHFRHRGTVVYRAEPYGPMTSAEIQLLSQLPPEWDFSLDPRGSTHYPGSTVQILFWQRA